MCKSYHNFNAAISPTINGAPRLAPTLPAGPSGSGPRPPPDGRRPWTAAEGRPGLVPARHAARQVVDVGPARGRPPGRSEGRRPAGHADGDAVDGPSGGLGLYDLRAMVTIGALKATPGTSPAAVRLSA